MLSTNDIAMVEVVILQTLNFNIHLRVASDVLENLEIYSISELSKQAIIAAYSDPEMVRRGPKHIAL